MADTARVHVTIEKSYMELVDNLKDVFGATKAQVISNIVQYFFNNSKNDDFIKKLRARKRKIKPIEEIERKIIKYLKVADKIPFEVFTRHLDLDESYTVDYLDDWGEKYGFTLIDNKIVKVR